MRGIYLCNYDINNTYSGVCKKIKSQVQIFEHNGIEMDVVDANSIEFKTLGLVSELLKNLAGCSDYNSLRLYDAVSQKLQEKEYDFIYMRRSLIDKHHVEFFRSVKQKYPKIKLLFEIPTYPYDNEIRLSRKIAHFNDKRYRKYTPEFADRIVTYSKDSSIFGVPTLVISNGIDYSKIRERNAEQHEGINVIAVALFERWHGYDRFLDGMYLQPEVVKSNNIHLHLAGKGRVLSVYKEEVEKYGLQEYVHFLGELHNEDLDRLYDVADIALDCMGRHRVGVYYNSSLKGKEYCAHGVPIISGIKTELDSYPEFPYYLRVPADDSILDMNDIVAYYHKCYDGKTSQQLAEDIRARTIQWFDFNNAFKPVIDFVKEV